MKRYIYIKILKYDSSVAYNVIQCKFMCQIDTMTIVSIDN